MGRARRTDAPLIRLGVLRTRSVWVAAVIIAFIGATVAGFFFLSLFLQNVLRYDPFVEITCA